MVLVLGNTGERDSMEQGPYLPVPDHGTRRSGGHELALAGANLHPPRPHSQLLLRQIFTIGRVRLPLLLSTSALPICLLTDSFLCLRPSRYFAVGSADALVSLWDVEDLACLRTFSRLQFPIRTVSFTHDSKMIASASEDLSIDVVRRPFFVSMEPHQ